MTKRKKKEHDIPKLFTENVAFIHCTASIILFTIETSFCFGFGQQKQHIFHFGYEKKYCETLWEQIELIVHEKNDCSLQKWGKTHHQIQILPYQIRSNFFQWEFPNFENCVQMDGHGLVTLFFRPFLLILVFANCFDRIHNLRPVFVTNHWAPFAPLHLFFLLSHK